MSGRFGDDDAYDRELSGIDLSAVQADDALLDALGGSDPKVADELGEAELNALLLSWSREVDSEPMPELVDVDSAVTTIKTATLAHKYRRGGGKRRFLVPVAAAAAVLGIAFGGASVAARDAQPGDALWGLTKVLYADKADSVQASYDVRAEFKAANDALEHGAVDEARNALEKAQDKLREVNAEEDRDGLEKQRDELIERIEGDPPAENEQPPPAGENQTSSSPSSPPPSSDPAEQLPGPEPTTPSENPTTTEPPPTTTSGSSTSTNDASSTGSTSQPDAGSAGTEGDGAGAGAGDGDGSTNEPVG